MIVIVALVLAIILRLNSGIVVRKYRQQRIHLSKLNEERRSMDCYYNIESEIAVY